MKLSEVRQYTKKDEAPSYYMKIQRNIGVYVSWALVNMFPSITANFVTVMTLILNLFCALLLFFAIESTSYLLLLLSAFLSVSAFTLDCADGNIARIKQSASIKGVFLDRFVHNISYPIFYLAVGFGLFESSGHMIYLVIFILVAILSELSPLDVSQKDVEALFIRQAFFQRTVNYNFLTHKTNELKSSSEKGHSKKVIFTKIAKSILENDTFFITIVLDLILFESEFYLTASLATLYILGKIYVNSNITKWEAELSSLLEQIYKHGKV